MHKLIRYSYIFLLVFMGCVTQEFLLTEEYNSIIFDDGIDAEEAVIIAKMELTQVKMLENYSIGSPDVKKNFDDVRHADKYWIVAFPKTRGLAWEYLVVVDKVNGNINLSRECPPDKKWVIEAHFLRLHGN